MKKIFTLSLFCLALFTMLTSGLLDDNGKAGYTNSPGENNCTTNCHNTFALNSGSGSVSVSSDIPGNAYTPGQLYNISLTVAHPGRSLFGLGFEALNSANTNAGTLTAGTGSQIKTAGNGRKNITHQLNGGTGTTDAHTFNFTWTAPAAGTGDVTFYYSGVAANGANGNKQDYVYNSSQVITEFVAPSGLSTVAGDAAALLVYPNPVNDAFAIRYQLQQAGPVHCGIYSLRGQLLQSLVHDYRNAGQHQEAAALSQPLPSGIYLLQLTSSTQSQTTRIVVQ